MKHLKTLKLLIENETHLANTPIYWDSVEIETLTKYGFIYNESSKRFEKETKYGDKYTDYICVEKQSNGVYKVLTKFNMSRSRFSQTERRPIMLFDLDFLKDTSGPDFMKNLRKRIGGGY